MTSRRRFLRAGGAALAAAVAGCSGGSDGGPETVETTDGATTDESGTTTDEPTSTRPTRQLDATPVDAADVPDGATVAVAARDLHQLVADAASADGRVDLGRTGEVDRDVTLALGAFDYVRFRGETYDASTSFAGFAQEASYQYDLVEANESEVEGEPLRYADLNESERDIADAMLNDSFSVGHHEKRPPAAETFEPQDYLTAENATYRIRVTVGDHAAHHMLTLDPVSVGEDARVVTVLDRKPSRGVSEALPAAVTDGSARVEVVDAMREYLDGVDYVVTATAVAEVELVRSAE